MNSDFHRVREQDAGPIGVDDGSRGEANEDIGNNVLVRSIDKSLKDQGNTHSGPVAAGVVRVVVVAVIVITVYGAVVVVHSWDLFNFLSESGGVNTELTWLL